MRINYNVTGADRKALVRTMVELLGEPPVYQGAPSFAYAVGGYRVDKDGMVSVPDDASSEDIHKLVELLQRRGFQPDITDTSEAPEPTNTTDVPEQTETNDAEISFMNYRIEVSHSGFTPEAEENLQRIIASKAPLLKKALGTDTLEIIITDTTIRFPWFTLHGIDGEADTYSRLITAICKMSKEQKRVVAKECATDNEKFAMRLFLIRLGFIGDEYKTARRILLRNLTGNSSWRSGHRPEQAEPALTGEAEPAPADTPADNHAEEKGGSPYEQ